MLPRTGNSPKAAKKKTSGSSRTSNSSRVSPSSHTSAAKSSGSTNSSQPAGNSVASDTARSAEISLASGSSQPSRSSHNAAIDGLRALAIIGVVAYHVRPSLLSGGFLGVTIFFVISGFLITGSVERRMASKQGFHYVSYLWRKIKRLTFPLLSLIALVLPAAYLFSPGMLPKLHLDALPSALYASNWVYIFRKVSYFAAAGLPSPLTHLWFLAVTMQFYLVWVSALWLMHRFNLRLRTRFLITLLLAVASTVLMMLLYVPGADVSRVYYGLDTRFSELMIGALLAFMVEQARTKRSGADERDERSGQLEDNTQRNAATGPATNTVSWSNPVNLLLAGAGFCLLAALIILYFVSKGTDAMLYRGGFQAVALIVALLIVVVLLPGNLFRSLLGSRVFRYIGSRSFSIYLVHYPLLEFMNPAIRTQPLRWWEWIVQFLILWAVCEAFYQVAEAARKAVPVGNVPFGEMRLVTKILASLGVVAVVLCTVLPVDFNQIAAKRSDALRAEYLSIGRSLGIATPIRRDLLTLRRSAVPKPSLNLPPRLVPKAAKVPKNLNTKGWTYDAATGSCSANPLIISDSVEMGAHDFVAQHIPASVQDNMVGRHFATGADLYHRHQAQGQAGSVVVMALGTNDSIANAQQVEDLIAAVGNEPLYLTTVRSPTGWQDSNNQILRSVVAKHKNVGLLDWYSISNGHPEYFYDDGTHLTPGEGGGREAYGIMIRQSLCGQ
ncbi:acyltransferase family protein [Bifidobacterium sp. ESL0769]|uniref:acyltransferase family protein n=1 Tax=Bifidobacterium sp. ESL0769 TaxID=2983229 RepID=UPI0023FA1277|nr:acyltransferase family protein [Bifidobacterium sp. ESL0769]WEV68333.1 acyltransferase family protein [Bifidobacterium sp. ESL0769]